MRSIAEFNEAFEKLNQELDAMSGEEFFATFGLKLDDLPSASQYSLEFPLNPVLVLPTTYSNIDLKCA